MRKLVMQPGSSSSTVKGAIAVLPWRQKQALSLLCQARARARDFVHLSAVVGGVESGPARDEGHGLVPMLDRSWMLSSAATTTTTVVETDGGWRTTDARDPGSFHVIRDDLLHPIMGGNKLRKLDALIPLLQAHGVTDVVTCGGCQSAHTAAVAVACAETGMKAHLLLRGERPAIPTGYNLVAGMYGHVSYVPRSEYANRQAMLHKYAMQVAGGDPSRFISLHKKVSADKSIGKNRVAIVNEGAGDCHAMLGLIRLVDYLSQSSKFWKGTRLRIVIDCGTGTTAVGLALGIALRRLPWQVVGVMLADTREGYVNQADRLLSEFSQEYKSVHTSELDFCGNGSDLPILWQERRQPRKFGRILPGEVDACRQIARETGILLDPVYTLAGWHAANDLCQRNDAAAAGDDDDDGEVALLHSGGTLGLFGLAQRDRCSNQGWLQLLEGALHGCPWWWEALIALCGEKLVLFWNWFSELGRWMGSACARLPVNACCVFRLGDASCIS